MQLSTNTPALITGGASGLGQGTAQHLASLGCPITVIDLPNEEAEAQATAAGFLYLPCDITDANAVATALAYSVEAKGIPRVVVNCAGIAPAMRTVTREGPHDASVYSRVVGVNLIGTFNVASQAAAHMVTNTPMADNERGLIVNTASVAAFDGQVGQAAYAASKAGVAGMTLPMARDLASLGIRVLTIAPGIFATPMVSGMPEDVQASLAAQIPFPKRLGLPSDYAALVEHMASNIMLNGEVIRLDGAIRMGAK